MVNGVNEFKDILEPRRQESSNFMWISRELHTVVAYNQYTKPSPKWHKESVLKSAAIREIIRRCLEDQDQSRQQIEKQIWQILNEIGYNKRLSILRWLGLLLTKICVKVCTGIHVNLDSMTRVKNLMGNNPVVFIPSHRSYADFILMSYIYFTYDIEIPAIAAGMDFHSMWGMGTVLRDTGAFFMRRCFNDDYLYWETFQQYISQLITKGDLPLEFFIEGTRSRSGKSLLPKFGLLSMILKPFFTSEVSDIIFVPINISYDRVLEEKLFAYELLGVPKPKESTTAFFKSLSIIKEQYGNIYVEFAEPISARKYFDKDIDRSVHSMAPLYIQQLTEKEKDLSALLAYDIIRVQQKSSMLTTFNLIALTLTNNFMLGKRCLLLDDLINQVFWLKMIVEALNARTNITNLKQDIEDAFNIHRGLIKVNTDRTVELVENTLKSSSIDHSKLKGHALSHETLTYVIPYIMLQIYVNPVLHYFVNPSMLIVIMKHHHEVSKDDLFNHYGFLRSLFSYEFVTVERRDNLDFQVSIKQLHDLNLINMTDDNYSLADKQPLKIFTTVLEPFIFTYYVVCRMLNLNATRLLKENVIITMAQAQLETLISKNKSFVHPYCLSLDTLANCIGSLTALSVLKKNKLNGDYFCEANSDALQSIIYKLEPYVEIKLSDEDLRCAQLKIFVEAKL